jgi:hypothetical protein
MKHIALLILMASLAAFRLTSLLYAQSAEDFVIEGTALTKYRGTAANVVIPEGITVIEGHAFSRCKNLTEITADRLWFILFRSLI